MTSINTNASAKFNFITKLWSIFWPQEQAARACGHHMEKVMYVYVLGSAGAVCPDGFSDKPGLMCHSAKVNSHLLSCGARRTLRKLCLIEISVPCLFISCIFNSQKIYMTVQSSLMPDPYFFFCFLPCKNM